MIAKTHADVLTILNMPLYNKGITSKEIFKAVTEQIKDSEIVEPEQISKINFAIRSKGLIVTFNGNKEKLHSITPAGRAALNEYTDAVLNKTLSTDKINIVIDDEITLDADKSLFVDPDVSHDLNTFSLESAIRYIQQQGFTVLNPKDELHAPFIDIVTMLEAASTMQFPSIGNKSEKIAVLTKLGNMLSDDLKTTIDTIINDLNQLEDNSNEQTYLT